MGTKKRFKFNVLRLVEKANSCEDELHASDFICSHVLEKSNCYTVMKYFATNNNNKNIYYSLSLEVPMTSKLKHLKSAEMYNYVFIALTFMTCPNWI